MIDIWIIFLALLFTFGIPLVVVFLIYYFENVRKPLELAKMGKYDEYTEAKKTIREKVIVKEIVMIPCQYCNGMMPETSTFCPYCGAPRKALVSEHSKSR
ncbi:MAG: zinc ribbon domain-containing protein [Candidatus Bathyarchaeota archaeon]|nr:zinc ribbon domain-containing protein [Candidatus Bathyarchaeota archaeon]MDH5787179.1 zinc ribbon domain-containing protein [Candidatus Bathyarchaeota archaeon]